ncbi:MAG: dihydroxyacetone kinase subunit DhaK [Bifidobacteriaceae bacterium]|jgi:dihydroxyacetone kinase-like protein|nr:dihydroxyacetone kinase subunit DhaK [Bifidobacteriaceae bacterium]
MKKLINTPAKLVSESLAGLAAAHREIVLNDELNVVYRAGGPRPGKVGVVCGGGSGHEPAHAGFVGMGMLDAAACGEIFTSPVPDQLVEATNRANGGAGVVQIVKNYTGDIMNFEMAREIAQASGDIEIETVVVDDDVAVEDSLYTAGRRGVGLTVIVEKLVGAAAESGMSLREVTQVGRAAVSEGRSVGLALTPVTTPASGKPMFDLEEDKIEFGVGIHGEPGRERRDFAPAAELAEALAGPILADLPFGPGEEVIALVNGMGATPLIELYVMNAELARVLAGRRIEPVRTLVGNYMTSLDMAGVSFTLLRATPQRLALWDAPVVTPSLRWGA